MSDVGSGVEPGSDVRGAVVVRIGDWLPETRYLLKTESNMLRNKSMRSYAAVAALALGLAPMIASCSNKATEEQMKTLHELDHQRDGLKMDLSHAQDNLRDAQGKLANQDRDLADCQADTRGAQEGLAKWPHVWPDENEWNPPPPPPPPVEPEKHAKKNKKH